MNNKLKVSDVALKYGISKRTIRYYEEIGILKSVREEGSNYRIYDDCSLNRLERILILRKLDFSINEVCQILESDNQRACEIFQGKLRDIQDEMNALASVQRIVKSFLEVSNHAGIDNVNIYQLLHEQIYIHKKVERMIEMDKYDGDLLRIEIGVGIIPYANSIIDQIKALRERLDIPLIRLIDNESIGSFDYRILYKGSTAIEKKLKEQSISEEIPELIKDLEEYFKGNRVEFAV